MTVESDYRDENRTNPQHVALGVDSTNSCYMTQTVMYNNTDWSLPEVGQFNNHEDNNLNILIKIIHFRLLKLGCY